MPNRIQVTDFAQLRSQEGGIFSVNGIKAKLFSTSYSEALFVTMRDGDYREWTVVAVGAKDLGQWDTKPAVYKIGSRKGK